MAHPQGDRRDDHLLIGGVLDLEINYGCNTVRAWIPGRVINRAEREDRVEEAHEASQASNAVPRYLLAPQKNEHISCDKRRMTDRPDSFKSQMQIK